LMDVVKSIKCLQQLELIFSGCNLEELTEDDIAVYAGSFKCPAMLNLSNCRLHKDTVAGLMKLNTEQPRSQFDSVLKEPCIKLKSSDGSNFCLNLGQ
jgi:hypothetical protein